MMMREKGIEVRYAPDWRGQPGSERVAKGPWGAVLVANSRPSIAEHTDTRLTSKGSRPTSVFRVRNVQKRRREPRTCEGARGGCKRRLAIVGETKKRRPPH